MKQVTHTNQEEWKYIPGFEGIYKIYKSGQIFSVKRHDNYRSFAKSCGGRFLKATLSNGYYRISLVRDRKIYGYFIHKLLAELFIPNPQNKPQVNHIDGVKTNNDLSNLEWVTNQENVIHAYKTGLTKPLRGEAKVNSKLTENQVREIRTLKGTDTLKNIAKRYGVTYNCLQFILRGDTWTHVL